MDQSSGGAPLTILFSGLAAAALGAAMLIRPMLASAWLKPLGSGSPHTPRYARKLAAGILAVGTAWLVVFLFEVIPFPHARPFWIVALSAILLPAAATGFLVMLFLAYRPRPR